MALLLEEGEEALADLVRRAHRAAIVRRGIRPPCVVGSSCASPSSEALPLSPAPAHAGRVASSARRARRRVGRLAPGVDAARVGRAAAAAGAGRPLRGEAGRRRRGAGAAARRRRRSCTTRSRRRCSASAAVLVDGKTGRVLWARNAHERRQVASTTKIMTALLALRKLQPHDIVTVDKSVPRVPLVREGLRAGERVAGVEALLLAAPLLRQRRRARARDRGRRRQVDVHPVDERRGEEARPARHALLDPERRQGCGQLLERVGSRRADARRDAQRALPPDRATRASST